MQRDKDLHSTMSPSSPPRVILVGCGAVARQFYVPALRALQDAGIVTLEMAAAQWLAPAEVLERITAFCRETGR